MKRRIFIPRWRHCEDRIELVARPTNVWFAALEHRHARFCVLANGEIWWGDGYTVLHQDICHANDGENHVMAAGVLKIYKLEDGWVVLNTQHFANGTTTDWICKGFLQRLTPWIEVEELMGPFTWWDSYGEEI